MILLTQIRDYTFLKTFPTTFYVGIGLYVASLIIVVALYKFPFTHFISGIMMISCFVLLNVASNDMIHQEFSEGELKPAFNTPKGAYIMIGILSLFSLICLVYQIIQCVQKKKESKAK